MYMRVQSHTNFNFIYAQKFKYISLDIRMYVCVKVLVAPVSRLCPTKRISYNNYMNYVASKNPLLTGSLIGNSRKTCESH